MVWNPLQLRKRNIGSISQSERISLGLAARLSGTSAPSLSIGLSLSKSFALAWLTGASAPGLRSGLGKRLGNSFSSTLDGTARLSGASAPGLGFGIRLTLLLAWLSGASAPWLSSTLTWLTWTSTPSLSFGESLAFTWLPGASAPSFGLGKSFSLAWLSWASAPGLSIALAWLSGTSTPGLSLAGNDFGNLTGLDVEGSEEQIRILNGLGSSLGKISSESLGLEASSSNHVASLDGSLGNIGFGITFAGLSWASTPWLGESLSDGLSCALVLAARLSWTSAPGFGLGLCERSTFTWLSGASTPGFWESLALTWLSWASAPWLSITLAWLSGTSTPSFGFWGTLAWLSWASAPWLSDRGSDGDGLTFAWLTGSRSIS